MKITKSLSGYSQTINKKAWKSICRQFKKSMAVPFGDHREKMIQQGLGFLENVFNRVQHTTKKDMESTIQAVKDTGASEFFANLDPKTAISLPAIYRVNPNNIFEYNGKQYYAVQVEEPRPVLRKSIINGKEYSKGQQYNGEVIGLDVNTGLPSIIPLDAVRNQITESPEAKIQVAAKINEEIDIYNERVKAISNATGVYRLASQLKAVEDRIEARLTTLNGQINGLQNQLDRDIPTAYTTWMKFLEDGIAANQFSIRDIFDSLIYMYQSNPQELVDGINDGSIKVPDQIKAGLIAIAQKESQSAQYDISEKRRENEEREKAIRDSLTEPSKDVELAPIKNVTPADVADKKYILPDEGKTLQSWHGSIKAALYKVRRDRDELMDIKGSLNGMRQLISNLKSGTQEEGQPKQIGQRSKEYLQSPEGQLVVAQLRDFINKSKAFFRRYQTPVVENGVLNPKLFGTSGKLGNTLVAVQLEKLTNVVEETLKDLENPINTVPPETNPPANQPANQPVIAGTIKSITLISKKDCGGFQKPKGHLDTQLFPECANTDQDRDVVKKEEKRKHKKVK